MSKYDELTERRITRIIEESVRSKEQAHYRPLQPKAQAISRAQAGERRGFEELQGE